MRENIYRVKATWDTETCGWILTSDEIRGLVLWAKSSTEIQAKLITVVPALIGSDGLEWHDKIRLEIEYEGQVTSMQSRATAKPWTSIRRIRALRAIGCSPIRQLGEGLWEWYSPYVGRFIVDAACLSQRLAAETIRVAGNGSEDAGI